MSAPRVEGMLTNDELARLVDEDEIDTVLVVFTDMYGRFLGKRLDAGFFLESAGEEGTHACNYLLTVDMEMEPVAGYDFANWERGYGDFHLAPDLSTLRVASWLERISTPRFSTCAGRRHSRSHVARGFLCSTCWSAATTFRAWIHQVTCSHSARHVRQSGAWRLSCTSA